MAGPQPWPTASSAASLLGPCQRSAAATASPWHRLPRNQLPVAASDEQGAPFGFVSAAILFAGIVQAWVPSA